LSTSIIVPAAPQVQSDRSILEVLAIAFALALDAFAVSFAASTAGFAKDRRAVFRLSFHFGLFQFLINRGVRLGMASAGQRLSTTG
jgi:putative Mn2+ efflux pump MntP